MPDLTRLFGGPFDARKSIEQSEVTHDPLRAYDDCIAALKAYGLLVDHLEEGEIVRCATVKSKGKKPAWYLFNIDTMTGYAVCVWGDWRELGHTNTWRSGEIDQLSAAERAALDARIQEAKARAEERRKVLQDQVAAKAQAELNKFIPAAQHDYLIRKKVKSHGLYMDPRSNDLVIPVLNTDGQVRNYQRIPKKESSDKWFLEDGEMKGCFFFIGDNFTQPTYVAEGYATGATVHELTGKSVVVVFFANNIQPVIEALKATRPLQQFMIAADNDRVDSSGKPKDLNTGITVAEAVCKAVQGVAYVAPQFPATSTGSDFNDLYCEVGQDETTRQLTGIHTKPRIELVRIGDFGELEPAKWIIKDFIPEESFCSLYGPSGHGKTFVALDFGLHIAADQAWHGREVTPGGVLYICGEGRRGIQKRISAWCSHHDIDMRELNFYVSSRSVPLLDTSMLNEFVAASLETAKQCGEIKMVIVDTLNRNFGDGNENSTEDMTKFIESCGEIQRTLNTSLMVVHHTGLADASRARGSSALRAAIDVEMRAEQPTATTQTRLTCTKMKDSDEFQPIVFNRNVIQLQIKGAEHESSCVLTIDKDPGMNDEITNRLLKSAGNKQKILYDILQKFHDRAITYKPDATEITVERTELNNALKDAGVLQNNWSRQIKTGVDKGWLIQQNEFVFEVRLEIVA